MNTPAIEARSLSSLTTLASNPPAYPRNPTHVRHEPLVLYIARVPGSRDVFLSPMKPREKVVTAEDIQSSLYYIHVDQPEDARLVAPAPGSGYADERPVSPKGPPVSRKAVPPTLAPPGMPAAPRRKPLPATLGPRTDYDSRQNTSAGAYAQRPPIHDERRSTDSMRYQGENEQPPPPLPPRRPSELYPSRTTLTLIRRDPASRAQWNVACIEDPPVEDVSSISFDDAANKKKLGSPMYLEITNPGYSKFLHGSSNTDIQFLANRTTDLSLRSQNPGFPQTGMSMPQAPRPQSKDGQANTVENTFRRRLWMEGMRYSNGGFGHRKNSSYDGNLGRQSPRTSSEIMQQRSSMDSRLPDAPSLMTRDEQQYKTIQTSDRQSSFRGYVFTSPWGGRCEFVTGTGGGSLKCRHVIPGLQGASPMAMPVSELRFNLPSSSKATTPGEGDSKRSSFFHRPRHSRNDSSVSEMDLSLGQEFAGGGFGGKQAKLGKLIIEDEGLKMMDLLVAANVALWWRAYDRVDSRSKTERGSV
ncbi:hypothetical protein BDV96DRAFT_81356 [Lophiotrema nucula]|uniref:Oxidoreductase-like protein n=1 Tax=Lophiotrema nucula TaxID=690887 RepID=A0A6A5Z7K7_9PLEO|nr:hypothetical protein BDV96DRAFT_81356 [Lophiotrema nucula]